MPIVITINESFRIKMYYKPKEHEPSHVHVEYQDYVASINIKTLEIIDGELPNKALKIARRLINANQSIIEEMWETQEIQEIK